MSELRAYCIRFINPLLFLPPEEFEKNNIQVHTLMSLDEVLLEIRDKCQQNKLNFVNFMSNLIGLPASYCCQYVLNDLRENDK